MYLILKRLHFLEPQILGSLIVLNDKGGIQFSCRTLELSWNDNRRNVSCVPEGCYPLVFEYSPKFDMNLWELKEVPMRSEAKIHVANYYTQLNGCIAVGDMWTKINSDEYPDLRNSSKTLSRLHESLIEFESETLLIEIL